MRRRELMLLAAGAALASRPGYAEPIPVVGYLSTLSEQQVAPQSAAFRRGLAEQGFTDGRDVEIDYRWAEGHFDRLREMAAEMVRRPVSLIPAQAPPAALAAKAATTQIPIVFVVGFDPVSSGLVESLNRPGGNATGMTLVSSVLGQKRLELIRDFSPGAAKVGMLINPISPDTAIEVESVEAGAKALGVQVEMFNASTPAEVDAAFDAITTHSTQALLIGTDPFFLNQRTQITALVMRLGVPAIYPFRDYVADGGLISYGTDIADSYYQAGLYAGRILKGARPADLPVMQPTKFVLIINAKVAAATAVAIPAALLARADEVIE